MDRTSLTPSRPEFISQDSSQTLIHVSEYELDSSVTQSESGLSPDLEDQLNAFAKKKEDPLNNFNEHTADLDSQLTAVASRDPLKPFEIDDGDLEFPEGGTKAYLVVFGSFMGLIACFGVMNIYGAIESYIKEHQLKDQSSSTIGWIFSIASFLTYTCCIFSGTYFDRNGTRVMLIIGTLLVIGGLMATASCKTVWQFLVAFGILTSIGNGLLMSPLVAVVAHYFKQKRALFSSLSTIGGSLGGVIFPIMLRALYPKVGFEWSVRILAFICLNCLLVSIGLARERLPSIKEKGNKMDRLKVYLGSFDFASMKDIKFVFNCLGALFAEISTVCCSTYFASYALTKGFTIDDSYILITLVNVGTIPGRLSTGILADIFGRFNIMIVTVCLTAVVNLSLWMPFGSSLKVLYAYAILYGLCSGSIFSLIPVCCGQISRTEEFGRRYSTMYCIIAFGVLGGIPVGGAIISSVGYNWFIVYTAITAILSSVCYSLSRYFTIGNRFIAKF